MKRLNKYVTRDQDAHHASSICRRVKGRPRSEDPKISIMCQAPLTRHDLQMTTAWGLGIIKSTNDTSDYVTSSHEKRAIDKMFLGMPPLI